jgi:hypothetical protein
MDLPPAMHRPKDIMGMSKVLQDLFEENRVPTNEDIIHQRLKLSDILDEEDWWRIYLARKDHSDAIRECPKDPGFFYNKQSKFPFQENMLCAYHAVLDGDDSATEFKTGSLTYDLLEKFFEVVTKNCGIHARSNSSFPRFDIKPACFAPDVTTEMILFRPLGDGEVVPAKMDKTDTAEKTRESELEARQRELEGVYKVFQADKQDKVVKTVEILHGDKVDEAVKEPDWSKFVPPTLNDTLQEKQVDHIRKVVKVDHAEEAESNHAPRTGEPISYLQEEHGGVVKIVTNTAKHECPAIVNEAFRLFREEMGKADKRHKQLYAIARLIRTLHVLHTFSDGNGRLNVYLLLPRLLLQHGFGPPLRLGHYFSPDTLYWLFNGAFSLDQIVVFLWFAQQLKGAGIEELDLSKLD